MRHLPPHLFGDPTDGLFLYFPPNHLKKLTINPPPPPNPLKNLALWWKRLLLRGRGRRIHPCVRWNEQVSSGSSGDNAENGHPKVRFFRGSGGIYNKRPSGGSQKRGGGQMAHGRQNEGNV